MLSLSLSPNLQCSWNRPSACRAFLRRGSLPAYLCPLAGAPRVVGVPVGEGAPGRASAARAGLRAAVGAAVVCVRLRLGGVEEHLQRGDRVQLRRFLVNLACRNNCDSINHVNARMVD